MRLKKNKEMKIIIQRKVFFETEVVLDFKSFQSLLRKALNKVYTHINILSGVSFG